MGVDKQGTEKRNSGGKEGSLIFHHLVLTINSHLIYRLIKVGYA